MSLSSEWDLQPDILSFSMSIGSVHDAIENDPEITQMKKQVDEYEQFVFILEQQIKERQERYQSTIKKISEQIENSRQLAEIRIQSQTDNQDRELEEFRTNFTKQMEVLRETPRKTIIEEKEWQKHHSNINKITDDIKITEVQKDIVHVDGEVTANIIENEANEQFAIIDRAVQNANVVNHYRNLEAEVDKYTFGLREQRSNYNTIINELSSAQTMKKEYMELCKSKIEKEMQKRQRFFEKHINILQKTINREKEAANSELDFLGNKLEILSSTKRDTIKHFTDLISRMSQDIEKMKDTLNKAEESDANELKTTTTQISSFDSTMRQTQSNLQLEKDLQAEIEAIRTQNKKVSACIRELSPRKSPSASPSKLYSKF